MEFLGDHYELGISHNILFRLEHDLSLHIMTGIDLPFDSLSETTPLLLSDSRTLNQLQPHLERIAL
jgi:hypothetical protein